MARDSYLLAEAVTVLQERGLLAAVRSPDGQEWAPPLQAEQLAGLGGSFTGVGFDNRTLEPGRMFVALPGEQTDGRRFAPAALQAGHWVLTRPVAGSDPLVPDGTGAGVLLSPEPETALATLASAWREAWSGTLIGVTGSNGKTTTKDMLGALLSAAGPCLVTRGNRNSKLGMPQTLLELRPEHRFAVIEMGASAVGHIAALAAIARPEVGLITNAGEAHLEEFGSLAGVIQGKGEMLDGLARTDRAVLNTESPGFDSWLQRCPCPVISFGREQGDHRWVWHPASNNQGPRLELDGQIWPMPLPGIHNAANLCMALLTARHLGLDDETLRRGLAGFRPSDNRSRLLHLSGRTVLDDSYNANPVSMRAAAASAAGLAGPGRLVAVLGHMAELGDSSEQLHEETGRALELGEGGVLLAVGPGAAGLARGFSAAGGEAHLLADRQAALDWLEGKTRPGDRVLIKGSRSAALDEIVEQLLRIWESEEESP
jgi:UDP-N-acetylmuramoyl-tripeptide--D-alanyl-D-alanine ligase